VDHCQVHKGHELSQAIRDSGQWWEGINGQWHGGKGHRQQGRIVIGIQVKEVLTQTAEDLSLRALRSTQCRQEDRIREER